MPLSEEELRALEQLERALIEDDPKLASTLRGTRLRSSARRNAILAGVAFLVGVGVLMAGAVLQQAIVGVIGFVVMLASATIGVTALRSRNTGISAEAAAETESGLTVIDGGRSGRRDRQARRAHPSSSSGSSFMERMEERWRRRREDRGY